MSTSCECLGMLWWAALLVQGRWKAAAAESQKTLSISARRGKCVSKTIPSPKSRANFLSPPFICASERENTFDRRH
jgi:hypothetical protein